LVARGWSAPRLIACGVPVSLLLLFGCAWGGPATGALAWAAFCVSCTVVSLSQPAIGQAFPATLAGRALSAYNLAIFLGVFMIQWGMGWAIDVGRAAGAGVIGSYQAAVGLLAVFATLAYAWFLWSGRGDGSRQPRE
ncbi:MAG: MFS transporter, partial [Ideonella sp.]|nr:MFS transporter [Ideonella sp.]